MSVYLRLVGTFQAMVASAAKKFLERIWEAYKIDAPVLITHWPSSLARIHWLASSNSKSCKSSTRLAYSGSFLRLRFRFLANHSGRGRAVDEPEIVYTGTAEWLLIFMMFLEFLSNCS